MMSEKGVHFNPLEPPLGTHLCTPCFGLEITMCYYTCICNNSVHVLDTCAHVCVVHVYSMFIVWFCIHQGVGVSSSCICDNIHGSCCVSILSNW